MNDFEWVNDIPTVEPLTRENARFGLIVKIRKDSEYYGRNSENNPSDVWGVIVKYRCISTTLPWRVDWDNGGTNSYAYKDLEVLK